MLILRSTTYDPATRILTARLAAPSGTSWAAYEYRDVTPELAHRIEEARPHARRVLATEVVPHHAVRRVGQAAWRGPDRP